MKFSAVQYMIPTRPNEAAETLERIIEQGRAAVNEGRNAVQGLRSSTVVANDLARAIMSDGERLLADQIGESRPEFQVRVEGKARDLPPILRDEIYRIACEALRNAFRHARARRIEVEIRYDRQCFRLRVVDDGKGIDTKVLAGGGREGHYGLPGIQERAELAGGKLVVRSGPDAGTEIELTIPASLAYARASERSPMSADA
jgi:signal transduction histidine kinase